MEPACFVSGMVEAGLPFEILQYLLKWSSSLLHGVCRYHHKVFLPLGNSVTSSLVKIPRKFLQLHCKKFSAVVDLTGETEFFSIWARIRAAAGAAVRLGCPTDGNWLELALFLIGWKCTVNFQISLARHLATESGEQDGTVVRALASHQCGPGSGHTRFIANWSASGQLGFLTMLRLRHLFRLFQWHACKLANAINKIYIYIFFPRPSVMSGLRLSVLY